MFLKECKYSDNEKKVIKYLTDDLKLIENSVYHASNVHFIYIYIYIYLTLKTKTYYFKEIITVLSAYLILMASTMVDD